jgi:Tol biopolymer transport system component
MSSKLLRTSILALASVLAAGAAVAEPLSLKPTRQVRFQTDEGTWMSVAIAPDGKRMLFDLLGDLYSLDHVGGQAKPFMTGQPFDTQAVFSPDGKRIAFVSDRSGAENLWIADADGSNPKQLSFEKGMSSFVSPVWAPDGQFVYVSRTEPALGAFELWMYDRAGGSGLRVTNAKANPSVGYEARPNALGAAPTPDGRYVYYATRIGAKWTPSKDHEWSILRRDLATGREETVVTANGGAFRPVLSPDGRTLAYAVRQDGKTLLRARDMGTGADRLLIASITRDDSEGGYSADLLPTYAFAPDGKSIVITIDGKFQRLDLAGGQLSPVPFTADVDIAAGPATRVQITDDTSGPVRARIIQTPRQSPDGRTVVFSALTKLYRMNTAGGAPVPVAGIDAPAFQPAWSPDGRSFAYITWTARDGGHIWLASADGKGTPRRITKDAAYYTDPVFAPDGKSIFALRSSQHARLHDPSEVEWNGGPDRPSEVVQLPLTGQAAPTLAFPVFGAKAPQFSRDGSRLYIYTGEGLISTRLDGTDRREHVRVTNRSPSLYAEAPVPMDLMRISPDGRFALAKVASQLYLIAVPQVGGPAPVIDLANPTVSRHRITKVGAEYFDWADDGKTVTWAVGSTFFRLPLSQVLDSKDGEAEAKATKVVAVVEVPRATPTESVVLRGATVITMKGDEVITDADVVVVAGRIAAVGKRGQVAVPAGAAVRDVAGKFITPGFVDTHAHWTAIRREVLDLQEWDYLANLAWGVTSGLDVQTFTLDALQHQDLIDAGLMIGPRAFSTGPGVFVNMNIDSKADTADVLTRYRDFYRTRNIKAYMVGDREAREFMVEAARDLGVMPTTEGASDLRLDLTHAIDGFAGNEHALPVAPFYKDVVQLFAQTRISYTPTLTVLYGGPLPLDYLMINTPLHEDPKVKRFMPHDAIDTRSGQRNWVADRNEAYPLFAAQAAKIQRAGGLVGMGSHGEVQGLGHQLEMQLYASGGATPHEVLKAGTILSSEVIGRAGEIGSLEPGKFADLVIFDADPLQDIKNLRSIKQVMKDGRLYNADTLDEVWPRERPLAPLWFWDGDR